MAQVGKVYCSLCGEARRLIRVTPQGARTVRDRYSIRFCDRCDRA